MGNALGTLFCLWVQSGFSTAKVASQLTFYPPTPTYFLTEQTSPKQKYQVTFRNLSHLLSYRELSKKEAILTPTAGYLTTFYGQRIPYFYYHVPGARLTLLYSHGNATDIGAMHPHYYILAKFLQINVFAYDYTGYGCATGEPSEANTYADISSAYDFLVETYCSDPAHEIVLYGQSAVL